MALELIEYTDPHKFRNEVINHLLEREAECCVPIGPIQRLTEKAYSPISAELDQPNMWAIRNSQQIELVAIQTLKDRMFVSCASQAAMEFLAEKLASQNWTGNGIVGIHPSVRMLAERYEIISRRHGRLAVRLGTFEISKVVWPTPVSGLMRICEPADRELLAQFATEFIADVGESSNESALATADRLIAARRIFFWVDRQPVAMAGWAGPTVNGVRVNFVYTPSEFRRCGYASNIVAHLTQRHLDSGRKFCFLFTDLANPTSNSIYQKIGYRPVAESERWEFE